MRDILGKDVPLQTSEHSLAAPPITVLERLEGYSGGF